MRQRHIVQNLWSSQLVDAVPGISNIGNKLDVFELRVTTPPSVNSWWIFVQFEDQSLRDLIFYHERVGNVLRYYRKNRDLLGNGAINETHPKGSSVRMNDVGEWMNYISSNVEDFWYIERRGEGNNAIKVYGWKVAFNNTTKNVADKVFTWIADWAKAVMFDFNAEDFVIVLQSDVSTINGILIANLQVTSNNIVSLDDMRTQPQGIKFSPTYFDETSWTLVFANSWVAAGTYGSSTQIPVLQVDTKWRVTWASTQPVNVSDGNKWDITVSWSWTIFTVNNWAITIPKISATGTANSTTYLRWDWVWFTPAWWGGWGWVQSVVAGANVIVDNTDPANPVVNAVLIGWQVVINALTNSASQTYNGTDLTWTLPNSPLTKDALHITTDSGINLIEWVDYTVSNNIVTWIPWFWPLAGEEIYARWLVGQPNTLPGGSAYYEEFTATAGQTTFTLTDSPAGANWIWVSTRSGLYGKQWPTRDYQYNQLTNQIIFNTPLSAGDVVSVQYLWFVAAPMQNNILREVPVWVVDWVNDTFTISQVLSLNTEDVYINWLLQYPTTDYTITGTTIVFTTPPIIGANLFVKGQY